MIVTIASFKGGVGKSTTAIHLAAFLNDNAPALVIDSDPNRSALTWAEPGKLPFKVVPEAAATRHIRNHDHIVIDTPARPEDTKLKELADGTDLLLLPTTPKALDLDALLRVADVVRKLGCKFKVLLTIVPPLPSRAGWEARKLLKAEEVPIFNAEIPRLTCLERAPLLGVLVKDYPDQRSEKAWNAYLALGKEVLSDV